MFAGGLMLLVSLYWPWQTVSCDSSDYFQGQPVCGLLHSFSDRPADGVSSEIGRATALFALLVAALAVGVWARPSLARRLPLGTAALLAAYFGPALAVETRSEEYPAGFTFHLAYGAYVGLVATILILMASAMARRAELARDLSASRLAMLVLVGGLLGSFLLPWWEVRDRLGGITSIGFASPAAVVAAALALCLPGIWARGPAERLVLAAAIALFTGAAASSGQPFVTHAYGVWVALAIAGALVVLVLVVGPRSLRLGEASWHALATCAAGGLFLASLFLPWQRWCYEANKGFGPLGGHCYSTNAWTSVPLVTTAAAVLAIALVVAVLQPRRLLFSAVELATVFGFLVITLGVALQEGGSEGFRVEHGYGSTIAFSFAAALVGLALVRLRLRKADWRRLIVRLAPIAACVAYLVIVVEPWWWALPEDSPVNLRFAILSWLTIVGALLGIRLLGIWARETVGAPASAELVLLPLALLALSTLDIIAARNEGISWGGGVVVILCLLLAVLGRIEERGDLDSVRIPEILRVDRL